MKAYTNQLYRLRLIVAAVVLLATFLSACSTTQPTSVYVPTSSPSATSTFTPEPPAATLEPGTGENTAGILLPSATPAPTATPDLVTELIQQVSQTLGVQDVEVLRVSAEDWLDLGISFLLVFIFGFLLARLVYYILASILARTKNEYAGIFLEKIRSQITLVIVVIGAQMGTSRLPFVDALIKLWLGRVYTTLFVVAATVILWRLLDTLVEWYQHDIAPQKDRHQIDTILLLLHRLGRVLLVMISEPNVRPQSRTTATVAASVARAWS